MTETDVRSKDAIRYVINHQQITDRICKKTVACLFLDLRRFVLSRSVKSTITLVGILTRSSAALLPWPAILPMLNIAHLHIITYHLIMFCGPSSLLYLQFRYALCEAVIKGAKLQDRSAAMLQSLLASTLSSFSPTEVVSDAAKKMCAKPLKKIAFMSRAGHLEGSVARAQLLADVVSVYSIQERADEGKAGKRSLKSANFYPVVVSVRQK